MPFVLDASAVIAHLKGEPGGDRAGDVFGEALISAINHAEVATYLCERGHAGEAVERALRLLRLRVVPFDEAQALLVARLRAPTRRFGLSLGDRACLALASLEGATVLTTDRAWAALGLDFTVEVIR